MENNIKTVHIKVKKIDRKVITIDLSTFFTDGCEKKEKDIFLMEGGTLELNIRSK